MNTTSKHPMQNVAFDDEDVIRFVSNPVVEELYRLYPGGLNTLIMQGFDSDDLMQFAQLIGYSVSGYGDLPWVTDESLEEADQRATALINQNLER